MRIGEKPYKMVKARPKRVSVYILMGIPGIIIQYNTPIFQLWGENNGLGEGKNHSYHTSKTVQPIKTEMRQFLGQN